MQQLQLRKSQSPMTLITVPSKLDNFFVFIQVFDLYTMPYKKTNIRKNGKAPLISATWKITIATDLYSGLLMTMWNEEHWIHKQLECSFTHSRLFTVSQGYSRTPCFIPWAAVRNDASESLMSKKTNTKTMTVKGKQVHIGSSFQRCTGAVAPSPICTTSH